MSLQLSWYVLKQTTIKKKIDYLLNHEMKTASWILDELVYRVLLNGFIYLLTCLHTHIQCNFLFA